MKKPVNIEFEQEVIAGMLNNDKCYFDGMADIGEQHFDDETTREVYKIIISQDNRKTANTLINMVKQPKIKSAIQMYDTKWKTRDEFTHAVKELKDIYFKRQLYYTIENVVSRFDDEDGENLVADIQNDINGFYFEDSGDNIVMPKDRALDALQEFYDISDNPELAKGIPYSVTNKRGHVSGFPSLDKAFHGAHGGDLIMIAAKTGEGKTGFALNLARLFSFHQKHWGYYMNTEMRIREMEARLLAPIARVRANEILHGQIEGTPQEIQGKMDRISSAFNIYMSSNLVMSRIPDLPLHKAQGLAKQVKSKVKDLEYIIVDYVGRMEVKNYQGSSWDELYEITKQLKELAIRMDVPIFLLAQRNHYGEVEGAKKMMNECDGVLFFEPTTEEDEELINSNVISAKKDIINYKIVKKKVRRDDNPYPIFVAYDKARNLINEVD